MTRVHQQHSKCPIKRSWRVNETVLWFCHSKLSQVWLTRLRLTRRTVYFEKLYKKKLRSNRHSPSVRKQTGINVIVLMLCD